MKMSKGSSTAEVLSEGYSTYSCPDRESSERKEKHSIDGHNPKLGGHDTQRRQALEAESLKEIVAPTAVDARRSLSSYVFVRIFHKFS
jgi:hypothetical protein